MGDPEKFLKWVDAVYLYLKRHTTKLYGNLWLGALLIEENRFAG